MKRDPHISKLIRESGVEAAPANFSASVMKKIEAIPARKAYKPLIGRGGRILIVLFIVAVVVAAIFITDPSGELFGTRIRMSQLQQQIPKFHLNLEFLDRINISAGIAAGLLALFVLVLSDAGLNRRRLSQ